ncbi:hypothetical protein DMI70_16530 [Escherichia coli]|nr:hypothetical protein [Escherichia coli]
MIQGGGFEPGMKQKSHQRTDQNEANNGPEIPVVRNGPVPAPHSATAQFFINVVDNDFPELLAKAYKVGATAYLLKWVEGMDVVTKSKVLQPVVAVCTVTCQKKTLSLKA